MDEFSGFELLVLPSELLAEGLPLPREVVECGLGADFGFEARIIALTRSSFRIELQPDNPFRLAISARSFQDCVFNDAVVIKGSNLRWNRDRAYYEYATVDSLDRECRP